jgi:protein-tyrosine kinase
VSRFFESLIHSAKANGKNTSNGPASEGQVWPDLASSLKSWVGSDGRPNGGETPSARQSGSPVIPKTGILGALGQLDNPQARKAFGKSVDSGESWRDLTGQIEVPPDLIEHAGEVACQPLPDERVLNSGLFQPSAQESFRVLCQRLLQVREQRGLHTVLITSPVPREGKTVVAINLASTLARSSPAVLLVDADLRHPRFPVLGIDPGPGLADYLAGTVDLAKAIRKVEPLGFYYLPAGLSATNPSELLQKPVLQEFINQAASVFDWVIFDSPSVNLFADPRYLATIVDGVLLVVREGVTPKELAIKSLAALDKAFVVGLVFNASTGSPYADYDELDRLHATEKHFTGAAME